MKVTLFSDPVFFDGTIYRSYVRVALCSIWKLLLRHFSLLTGKNLPFLYHSVNSLL